MYYMINAKSHFGYNKKFSFDGFDEIKNEVVKMLDGRGWDNKDKVDLRSLSSCLSYLFEDYSNYEVFQTRSFDKFIKF